MILGYIWRRPTLIEVARLRAKSSDYGGRFIEFSLQRFTTGRTFPQGFCVNLVLVAKYT